MGKQVKYTCDKCGINDEQTLGTSIKEYGVTVHPRDWPTDGRRELLAYLCKECHRMLVDRVKGLGEEFNLGSN
jgi:transposase-like protein